MKHVEIVKDIEYCDDCPYRKTIITHNQTDSDSWYSRCTKENKDLTKNGFDYSKIEIPKWCPLRDANGI